MIYYITGGSRSGKSRYAQEWALRLSSAPVYLATARHWDENFVARIQRHVSDRDERWTTIEEEKNPSKIDLEEKVVVIDCVTLWLTNLFVDGEHHVEQVLHFFKAEIDALAVKNATYLIISNELGMGVHAETEISRKFTDLQGWANQYLAQIADQAIFMVSGIPLKLK